MDDDDDDKSKLDDDKSTNQKKQDKNDDDQSNDNQKEAYKAKLCERQGDMIIRRRKIQLFRFWPKHLLRDGWLKYVSAASENEQFENKNAAFLALLILEKVTK